MSTASVEIKHREEWLHRFSKQVEPWFEQLGYPITSYRISVGFPSAGRKGKAIGECWAAESSRDKHYQIFVHPKMDDPLEVGATVVHELVHAAVGVAAKHGTLFRRVATAVGLEGKMKATVAGERLLQDMTPIINKLGPYPHGALDTNYVTSERGPKQSTRMIKVECPECAYILRASRGCLELGIPQCPNPNCPLSVHVAEEYIPMIANIPDEIVVIGPDIEPKGN